MKRVVVDTSPLIVLAKADLLGLLPAIFEEVVAPQAVYDEVMAGPFLDPMRKSIESLEWLKIVNLSAPLTWSTNNQLGPGEVEVIEFARQCPGWGVLIDDRAARRSANALGIPVVGTLTLVGAASERNLVPSFDQGIERLRSAGLFVTDELIDFVRRQFKL
jgi:predicted nucleic acid-binding protein